MTARTDSLVFKIIRSPVGRLKLVATDCGLVAVLWTNHDPKRVRLGPSRENKNHPILIQAERELGEYFAGQRHRFSVPLHIIGTPFQKKVWQALAQIPFGGTCSYQELAEKLGNMSAARAVGAANGKNPLSIIVPCHRLIGASGDLTGFAGGLKAKAYLLRFEEAHSFKK
jgi:methylated-DNA-[protein]-cysteine S-methyltransferase